MKIEIKQHIKGGAFNVYVDDGRIGDCLAWSEMMGVIASLTMPEKRTCLSYLHTQEEIDKREEYFNNLKGVRKDFFEKETDE